MLKYMYLNLNGSKSVKVILVCVLLGSAHKVSVFSSIEIRISCKFWITALRQSASETVKCDKMLSRVVCV